MLQAIKHTCIFIYLLTKQMLIIMLFGFSFTFVCGVGMLALVMVWNVIPSSSGYGGAEYYETIER